jgi:hypothetical protein
MKTIPFRVLLPVLGLLPAVTAAVAADASSEEKIVLQPFEVVSDKQDTYEALNFSSLSGTNRSLDKLPISAEIFNQTML